MHRGSKKLVLGVCVSMLTYSLHNTEARALPGEANGDAGGPIVLALNELDEPVLVSTQKRSPLKHAHVTHKTKTKPKKHKKHAHHLHHRHPVKHRIITAVRKPQPPVAPKATLAPPPAASAYSFHGPYAGFGGGLQFQRGYTRFPAEKPISRNTPNFSAFTGFGYEIDRIVAGVEADVLASPFGTLSGIAGSFRTRLGVKVFDNTQIYTTAGLAIGGPLQRTPFYQQNVAVGWIGGGGLETLITPTTFLRVEYLREGIGRLDGQTIRTGLGLHF